MGTGDATPALVGDKLYVFTRQGDEEVLQCLNAADGKILWQKDQHKQWPRFFTASSPIIVDGLAVLQLGGDAKGEIVAFDLAKGDVKWTWSDDGAAYSSPVLLTADGVKQIVTMTAKNIVGLGAADGKKLWEAPFPVSGRMGYNAATPIVDGQTVIFTDQGRGTKAVKVEKKGDGFAATQLWSNDQLGTQFNTPVLKDGLLFGLSDKALLYCISAKDGKPAWVDSTKRGRNFAAILDVGPVLLALPDNGELVVYKPTDKAFAQVASVKVADTPTYATPVVAGNRIFVKAQDTLALLTVQ